MLRVTFHGPMLVGGVEPQLGAVDRMTMKDETGVPMLPVSALKGAWRIELERLSRALSPEDLHHLRAACDLHGADEDRCPEAEPCIACLVFGNERSAGRLRILSPQLDAEHATLFSEREERHLNPLGYKPTGLGYAARHRVAINRRRQVAEDQRLFLLEATEPGLRPVFSVALEWRAGEGDLDRVWNVVTAAARMISAIGASRGVGYGRCEVEVVDRPALCQAIELPKATGQRDLMLLLQLGQPLCVAVPRREGFTIETFTRLTGSALRGSLASAVLRRFGRDLAEREVFRRLFVDPNADARFDDGLPVSSREPLPTDAEIPSLATLTFGAQRPFPAPLSALTCKKNPGPLTGSGDAGGGVSPHGVFDTLLLRGVINALHETSVARVLRPVCPGCGSACQPAAGDLATLTSGIVEKLRLGTLTRASLSRRAGRAQDERVYSIQVIEAGAVFSARIRNLDDECAGLLTALHGGDIEVGTGRSRGLGACRVVFAVPSAADPDPWRDGVPGLEARLRRMGDAWRAIRQVVGRSAGVAHAPPAGHIFSVTLIGDALLGGEDDIRRVCLGTAESEAAGIGEATLLATLGDQEMRRGYHDYYRIRKPQEVACKHGSTALFLAPPTLPEAALLEHLAALERDGVGRRRSEGFGEVAVCHPFHSQFATSVF
jgi:CRISPR-associated protein Csx10